MAEDKIYLDLEPTAAQVKKGIEEIVEKLTENVVENKDKIFTLEVDTENIPEDFNGALTDDMLDKVKIRLKTVSAISPVEGKLGQMIMSDGNNWIKKSEFYTSLFSNGNAEEGGYTEVRFGPDLIDNPNINGRLISRLVLSGNPLSLEDKDSSATLSTTRTEQADAKTFKMVIANTAKATFRNSANVTFQDNANVMFKGGSNVVFRDNAQVTFKDSINAMFENNAIVGFRHNASFTADNNGLHFSNDNTWKDIRFTLSDGAKTDITGDNSGSPEVYIHGKCHLNLDRGYERKYNSDTKEYFYTYNYAGNNAVINSLDGATIAVHDKAMLAMSEGAYLTASDTSKTYFEGNSTFKVTDNAEAYFEKDSKVYMQGGHIVMDAGTLLFCPEHYKPCINMNGGGQIVFNAYSSISSSSPDTGYDPYLIANPTSFVFLGQGSNGSKTNATGIQYPGDPIIDFNGGPSALKPSRRNPQIQIADETMIIIDATQGGGSNYLKIGACGGGQTQTHILDNTHLELRQNSLISLRGRCQNTEAGPIGDFPITRHNGPPDGTGSMLTMYDNAVFIMRSEWPEYKTSDYTNKKDHRGRDLSESTWKTDLDFWRRYGSPLFGMVGNSMFKMQGAATIDMNTNSSISMENESSINLNNGKIYMDNQEITFEQGGRSITLTLDQLNSLTSNSVQTTEIENSTEFVSEYLPKTNMEYRFTTGTVKSITFNNLSEEDGLSNDYWALFIFMKDSSTSSVNDIILNEDIKILNPDLDISTYTILHLLFTYDGFNICCKVAGY